MCACSAFRGAKKGNFQQKGYFFQNPLGFSWLGNSFRGESCEEVHEIRFRVYFGSLRKYLYTTLYVSVPPGVTVTFDHTIFKDWSAD